MQLKTQQDVFGSTKKYDWKYNWNIKKNMPQCIRELFQLLSILTERIRGHNWKYEQRTPKLVANFSRINVAQIYRPLSGIGFKVEFCLSFDSYPAKLSTSKYS